jgi:ketosteroid isomerase-like protein
MKTTQILILVIAGTVLFTACQQQNTNLREQAIDEIKAVEKEFNDSCAHMGIAKSFVLFAHNNVAMLRGGKLIVGIPAVDSLYKSRINPAGVQLTWVPTYVDASASGDLGYSYGTYNFSFPDSTGKMQVSTGYFHTVWKKQSDGKWRYVWD